MTTTTNYATQIIHSTRTLPIAAEIKLVLTRLQGYPVYYWIARGRYTYAFNGDGKVARAAMFTGYCREHGIEYVPHSTPTTVEIEFYL